MSTYLAKRQIAWLAFAALSVAVAAGCGEPAACVIIDNGGGRSAMTVAVDNQQAISIPARESKSVFVAPGQHQFSIKVGGRSVFNGAKIIEPSKSWGAGRQYVFNPSGNQRYAVCKVVYGSSLFNDATENTFVSMAESYKGEKVDKTLYEYVKMKRYAEPMPPTAWFELPGGIRYILEAPPESVYSKSGSTSRRVLTRIPSQDHNLLRRGHTIEKPTPKDLSNLANVTERVLDSMSNLEPSN
jgi:hypothetical protein